MRLHASLLVVSMLGCGRNSEPRKQQGSAAPTTEAKLEACAPGEVVATAPDGAYVVRRKSAGDVCAADGNKRASLPASLANDTPGNWFAVSRGAAHVVFVSREGPIEVW